MSGRQSQCASVLFGVTLFLLLMSVGAARAGSESSVAPPTGVDVLPTKGTPTPYAIPTQGPPSWNKAAIPAEYAVFIHSVSPSPPECVYRFSGDPGERTLTIVGEDFSTTDHNLQFRRVDTGGASIHFHAEVNWVSTTRITVDMNGIKDLLWSDPRITLNVRITTYVDGNYVPVSDWSPEFILSDDESACYATPTPLPEPSVTPPPEQYRVVEIIYNPIIEAEGDKTLIELKNWNDPVTLDAQHIADVDTASHGDVNYLIVDRYQIDDFPRKLDGFDYDDNTYLACLSNTSTCHQPDTVDYGRIFEDFDICTRVLTDSISEVWLWGGPYFGYWEYNVRGPSINITPENIPLCGNKTIYVMGFNYERGNPEMLEDMGHRTEGILAKEIADDNWQQNEDNDWNKFSLVAAPVSTYPYGHCGNVHYPPNGTSDYDWANTWQVSSDCDDWYNYPTLSDDFVTLNCEAWGCDGYDYKKWWLHHLPHASGIKDGHINDWWCYVMDYEAAKRSQESPGDVTIATGEEISISLDWSPNSSGYDVWEGTVPFFTPGDGHAGTRLLDTTASPQFTVLTATGDPETNRYYVVLGVNHCGHAAADISNRVGEFDYSLFPGTS